MFKFVLYPLANNTACALRHCNSNQQKGHWVQFYIMRSRWNNSLLGHLYKALNSTLKMLQAVPPPSMSVVLWCVETLNAKINHIIYFFKNDPTTYFYCVCFVGFQLMASLLKLKIWCGKGTAKI